MQKNAQGVHFFHLLRVEISDIQKFDFGTGVPYLALVMAG